jgi:hypothetical protein
MPRLSLGLDAAVFHPRWRHFSCRIGAVAVALCAVILPQNGDRLEAVDAEEAASSFPQPGKASAKWGKLKEEEEKLKLSKMKCANEERRRIVGIGTSWQLRV